MELKRVNKKFIRVIKKYSMFSLFHYEKIKFLKEVKSLIYVFKNYKSCNSILIQYKNYLEK